MKKQDKQDIRCKHCKDDRLFSSLSSLRSHVCRIHADIVNASKTFKGTGFYKCKNCSRGFNSKDRLSSHNNKCPENPDVPSNKKVALR